MTVAATYRIAIVGASSVAGKELADAIAESPLATARLTLLDEEGIAGQLTAAGEDISVVQKLDADSFDGMDFVFFAGPPTETLRYWRAVREAGAATVDLSGALGQEPGAMVRAPWVLAETGDTITGREAPPLDLNTSVLVSAHPATMMLLAVAGRLGAKCSLGSLAATVFEPASAHGQAAMDELHQQTVSLLSFQSLPRAQFDAQTAFNLLAALGENASVDLEATRARIAGEYAKLAGGSAALALQVVAAPVFHSSVLSVLVDLAAPASVAQVETALRGGLVDVPGAGTEPPSNVSAVGQGRILTRVSAASPVEGGPEAAPRRASATRFWIWMAADNLRLAALNAIACAGELRRVRPQGKVQ